MVVGLVVVLFHRGASVDLMIPPVIALRGGLQLHRRHAAGKMMMLLMLLLLD